MPVSDPVSVSARDETGCSLVSADYYLSFPTRISTCRLLTCQDDFSYCLSSLKDACI